MPQDEVLYQEDFIQDEVSYNLIHLLAGSPQNLGLKSPDGRMIFAQSPRGNAWLWISRKVSEDRQQHLLQALVSELKEVTLPGVTGEPDVAEQFASCYAEERRETYRHHMTMESYHACREAPHFVEGTIRQAALKIRGRWPSFWSDSRRMLMGSARMRQARSRRRSDSFSRVGYIYG